MTLYLLKFKQITRRDFQTFLDQDTTIRKIGYKPEWDQEQKSGGTKNDLII